MTPRSPALPCAGFTTGLVRCQNTTTSPHQWCGQCAFPPWQKPATYTPVPSPSSVGGGARVLAPDTLTVSHHAQERFVLRFGGTLVDAEANVRTQLSVLAGQTAPVVQDWDEHGTPRRTRHYPVGHLTYVVSENNKTLITVLPTRQAPGESVAGVEPHTVRITRRARSRLAELIDLPEGVCEERLREMLTNVKGRVAPVKGGQDSPGTREYLVGGLTLVLSADNKALITLRNAAPRRAAEPAPPASAELLGSLASLMDLDRPVPRITTAALSQLRRHHPALDDHEAEVNFRVALSAAARVEGVAPSNNGGYAATWKKSRVFLSADGATITGYHTLDPAMTPVAWAAREAAHTAPSRSGRPRLREWGGLTRWLRPAQ